MKEFTAPIRLLSEANEREHWRTRHRRKKQQQSDLKIYWRVGRMGKPKLPCHVVITRIGKRRLDSDNLAGACKHVQDQIARELGVDDGSALVAWEYAQEVGRVYSIRVRVLEVLETPA